MGYELKIMIGRKFKADPHGPPNNEFDVLAMVDLCQCDAKAAIRQLADFVKDFDNEGVLIADDHGLKATYDDWGNKFIPVPVEAVLEALIEDFQKYHYKRFGWAIGLLSKMVNDNLSVIFYGH